jgi:hypothetical protein
MAAAPDLRLAHSLFDRMKPIDVDTHITEPPDVWTARVSKKWGDQVPHIKHIDGRDLWLVGDQMIGGPGFTTAAGFKGSYPEFRNGFHDIPKSSWDAKRGSTTWTKRASGGRSSTRTSAGSGRAGSSS